MSGMFGHSSIRRRGAHDSHRYRRAVGALTGIAALLAGIVAVAPPAAAAGADADSWAFFSGGGGTTGNGSPFDAAVAHDFVIQLNAENTSAAGSQDIVGAQLTATVTGPAAVISALDVTSGSLVKAGGSATFAWAVPKFAAANTISTELDFTVPAGVAVSADTLTVTLSQTDSTTTHDGFDGSLPGSFTSIVYTFSAPPPQATHTVTITKDWEGAVAGDTATITLGSGKIETTATSTAPDGSSTADEAIAPVVTGQFATGATVPFSEVVGNQGSTRAYGAPTFISCSSAFASHGSVANTWTFTMPDQNVTCTIVNTLEVPKAPSVQKHVTIRRPDGSGGFTTIPDADHDVVRSGDQLEYTIAIQGEGQLPYSGAIATDDLSTVAGVDFSSLTQSDVTVDGSGVTATLKSDPQRVALTASNFASDASASVTFSGTIAADLVGVGDIRNDLSGFSNCIVGDGPEFCGTDNPVAPAVSLSKSWVNGRSGDMVDLTVTSSVDGHPSASGTATVGATPNDAVLFLGLGDDSAITITESGQPGTDLGDYSATWACTVPAAGTNNGTEGAWSGTGTTGTFALSTVNGLANGGRVSCAFTNTAPAAASTTTPPPSSSSASPSAAPTPTTTPDPPSSAVIVPTPTTASTVAVLASSKSIGAAVVPATTSATTVRSLAYTGSPMQEFGWIALALLLAGAGLITLARRVRRPQH